MNRATYYKRMFYASAAFNFIISAGLLFGENIFSKTMGVTTVLDPLAKQLFVLIAGVFGVGYWIVARDITRNEGIVALGILGKLFVVAILFGNVVAGRVDIRMAAPGLGDLIFAALFAEFLMHRERRVQTA